LPYVSVDVPKPVGAVDSIVSTLDIADIHIIYDINVQISALHTYDGDLKFTLIAPGGQRVILANRRGANGDNFINTVFDDQADTAIAVGHAPFTAHYQPDQPLSVFNGLSTSGRWTLAVQDLSAGDVGILLSWEILIATETAIENPANPVEVPHLALLGNFPNPFNSTTQIHYLLPQSGSATLTLYNVLGQEVTTLFRGVATAGRHQATWDGRDSFGRDAASGIYMVRLEASGRAAVGKMFLLR
jgi:subtilisin-like proprotein convertase family protein